MGNLLKWKSIDPEATYTVARIYRATTETGLYGLVGSQNIEDQSYYDGDGTISSWYKIDFYDSATGKSSAFQMQSWVEHINFIAQWGM